MLRWIRLAIEGVQFFAMSSIGMLDVKHVALLRVSRRYRRNVSRKLNWCPLLYSPRAISPKKAVLSSISVKE
jgi:hypothetical protein